MKSLICILTLLLSISEGYAYRTWEEYPRPVEIEKFDTNPLGYLLRWNWFVDLEGGFQKPSQLKNIAIYNGSGLASPYNIDNYSTKKDTGEVIGLSGGFLAHYKRNWLPNYSLALRYRYQFPINVGQYITAYSSTTPQNYTYTWKMRSNLFTLQGKTNIFQFGSISPSVGAGLGFAATKVYNYAESPFKGVNARSSPAFGDYSVTHFTYNFNAGLDYYWDISYMISLSYEWQHLGLIQSGYGSGPAPWTTKRLNDGNINNNLLLLTVTHLFWN